MRKFREIVEDYSAARKELIADGIKDAQKYIDSYKKKLHDTEREKAAAKGKNTKKYDEVIAHYKKKIKEHGDELAELKSKQ